MLVVRIQSFGRLPGAGIVVTVVFLVLVTLVGVGLLILRKWAAIAFSLALIGLPTWIAMDSIGQSPAGFHLMLAAATAVLVMPIIIIVRSWRLLSWRGRWFL